MTTPDRAAVEQAHEKLKQRALAYCKGASAFELEQMDRQAALARVLSQIGLLTDLSAQVVDASAIQEISDALLAEYKPTRDAIEKVLEQYEGIVKHVDKAIETLNRLGEFEYLRGLQIVMSMNTITEDSAHLKRSYDELLVVYDRLMPPPPGAGGVDAFEQQCNAVRAKKPAADKLLNDIDVASRHLAETGSELVERIRVSAVRAYIDKHRTASMEMVEYVNKDVKELIDYVGGKIGGKPGPFQWILPLVDIFREAAYLLADELVKSAVVADYLRNHTTDELFAEFTKDPLLMPEHLVALAKRNLHAALALLSILGRSQPKIWSLVTKVIEAAFDEYFKRRLDLAKEAMARLESGPAKPNPDTLQQAVTKALGEIWTQLENDVSAELQDPKFWRKVLEAQAEGKLNVDWVVDHLTDLMIKPIVSQIIKALPVTPAQIVTGADLSLALSLSEDMIPEAFRTQNPGAAGATPAAQR